MVANCPEGDGRERGVLAVGGEDPRVVGVAGGEPPGVRDRAERRRVLLALVGPPDLQVRCRLGEVGEILLAPVERRAATATPPCCASASRPSTGVATAILRHS